MSYNLPTHNFKEVINYKDDLYIMHEIDTKVHFSNTASNMGSHVTFSLCHRGSATVLINEATRHIKQGAHLVIIPNAQLVIQKASADFNCTLISIKPEFRPTERYTHPMPQIDALLYIKEQPVMMLNASQQDYFIRMRDIMAKAIHNIQEPYLKSILIELVHAFGIWEESTIAANINATPPNRSSRDIMVTKFLWLVNEHFCSQHRLEFYADTMSVTAKYLSTTVKAVTGHTASQWIDIFLINEAKNLILSSTKSVAQISDTLGFVNQSFFGKFFKKHVGKTPLAYRFGK